MDKSEQLEVSQADRDAAANIWRDYVARVGECIAEKAIREGASDCTMIVQAFARHRQATEARMAAAVEAERERCARIVERRAEARFNEHGTREWDTNATYYQGDMAEIYEALDEEADEIAAAIRSQSNDTTNS